MRGTWLEGRYETRGCCSGSREKRHLAKCLFWVWRGMDGQETSLRYSWLISMTDGLCELREGDESLMTPKFLPKEWNNGVLSWDREHQERRRSGVKKHGMCNWGYLVLRFLKNIQMEMFFRPPAQLHSDPEMSEVRKQVWARQVFGDHKL